MIQILSTLDEGTCANCGGDIRLLQGDLDRVPHWSHKENGYKFCPGSPTARPATTPPTPPTPPTNTASAAGGGDCG